MGLAPEGCSTGLSSLHRIRYELHQWFPENRTMTTRASPGSTIRSAPTITWGFATTWVIRAPTVSWSARRWTAVALASRAAAATSSSAINPYSGRSTTTLKPTLINSALVQWGRRHYNFPGATGQPDFSVTNDLELGHNFGTDDQKYESRIQFSDCAFLGQRQPRVEIRI